MNWGYKIIIVYVIFISGILYLVYRTSLESADLVTTDYYEKELMYQQKIDTEKRTSALSQTVWFDQRGSQFNIHFPKDFHGKKLSGKIELYCPSDEKKDQHKNFDLNDGSEVIVFRSRGKGMNILQVSWQADGLQYYSEQKVIIL